MTVQTDSDNSPFRIELTQRFNPIDLHDGDRVFAGIP